MNRFRWLMIGTMAAAIVTAYFILHGMSAALHTWLSGEKEITVRVEPVHRGSVPLVVRLSGVLSPAREQNIVSRLSGSVREVRFKAGDSVPNGTVVAVVDSAALASRTMEIEAALGAARNEAKASEERAIRAETAAEQSREWQRRNLIARRDLDLAQTAARTARAQAELARSNFAQQEAMLAQIRALQSLTRLSAPFSGVITRRWVDSGAAVKELDPVLTIADPRSLKLSANYGGPYSGQIRSGMKVAISNAAAPQEKYVGQISRIESGADGKSQHIIIEVENEREQLPPGMAVQGFIDLAQQEDVLLAPRSAVILLGGTPHVYKAVNGRAVPQEVFLGEEIAQEVIILKGLKEGEQVIVDSLSSLQSNSRLRITAAVPLRMKIPGARPGNKVTN